jgi:DNA-directed RNA polymerase specialized sigma24 family protein
MAEQGSITCWIEELRLGRAEAAEALWRPYFERLVRLARQKLGMAPRSMADEEDVALSVFHSFCAGAAAGRFPRLSDRDDLWQVLVMLTIRKAANLRKLLSRQKRGGGRVGKDTDYLHDLDDSQVAEVNQLVGNEPTPEFAAQVAEECRRLLNLLDDATLQTVAVAKMEGYTNDEIAQRLQVKTRTIERKLNVIRTMWKCRD